MGLLDLFGKKSGSGPLKKHATRVASKRAQSPDRWESINALGQIGTPEAVDALIERFTIHIDPSITDQEEKEATVDAIVRVGEPAVEPVRRYLERVESIAWPLKCLERLLDEDRVVGELLGLLDKMDTEYERNPEKKLQVLTELEERRDSRIVESVRPFLDDVNEPTRFHAVSTLLAQAPPGKEPQDPSGIRDILLEALRREESMRIRARILDGFIERGWTVGSLHDEVRPKLPHGYVLDGKGAPRRS